MSDEAVEPKALRFPIGSRWRVVVNAWRPQWREWFGKDYNWRNFTVLRFDIEAGPADGYKGRYVELTMGLLGFVFDIEAYDKVDRAGALSPIERRAQDWEERNGNFSG